MFSIYCLFSVIYILIFDITIVSVNSINTCQLESSCKQSSIECNNLTDLCYCLANNKLYYNQLATGVCLQSANVNIRCMIYQPCLRADCTLTNGLKINFNDRKKRNTIWQTLLQSVLNQSQQQNSFDIKSNSLGFCRCNKARAHQNCNYRVIGSQCSHQKNCYIENSVCANGVCACNQSHYHLDDNCLLKKTFDDICSDSTECQTNLYCKSSQCRCRKNYDFNNQSGWCLSKSSTESNESTNSISANLWDHIAKVGGFIIIVVLMLFLCTKKESELQNDSITGSYRRRHSSRSNRQRSSSINSHRPLCQTSSNASRSSAYRTFEEPVPIRQTIIIPSPSQLIRSLSSTSDEVDYNPYQFDTLFPQQSDNDDPPSYEEVVNDLDKH